MATEATPRTSLAASFSERVSRPVDAAGLAAFRIGFGLLMFGAVVRFVARGWVDELLLSPSYHFTYLGFDWVAPLPRAWMYGHFAVLGALALSIAAGFATRFSALAFAALFTYAELIDKATYLNHYYFVSLVALLLAFVPANATWSLDARRARRSSAVAYGSYLLLRVQVAVVYLYAGLAKLDYDWLFRAEPLRTWLRGHAELPVVGGLLAEPATAFAMSWAGAAFDLSVVPLLCIRRTRPFAVVAATVFHLSIWLLFPIGVFSFVMLLALTIFFSPSWPRLAFAKLTPLVRSQRAPHGAERSSPPSAARTGRPLLIALALAYVAVQLLLPLRHLLYAGPVNWTEQGFRFAWRVMLIEKTGRVEYEVVSSAPRHRFRILPRDELTPLQVKMLSTQPDMIHDYARHLADRYEARGYRDVEVRADAWVAFNGRPSQRLIDPTVDLAREPRSLRAKSWIVPLQTGRKKPVPAQQETVPKLSRL
jgi:vitamin K-dependent gamma-carboxylase